MAKVKKSFVTPKWVEIKEMYENKLSEFEN